MDAELTQAFATLSHQLADVGRDARRAVELSQESAHESRLAAHEARAAFEVARDTAHRVERLEAQVFGSTPPAPPNASAKPPIAPPRIVKRVSETEMGLDKVHGMVLAIDGRCGRIEDELAAQSRVMGVGLKGLKWATSPAGRLALVRLATLVGALYAAFHAANISTRADSAPAVVTVPSTR